MEVQNLVAAVSELAAQLHLKRMARIIVDDKTRPAVCRAVHSPVPCCLSLLKDS